MTEDAPKRPRRRLRRVLLAIAIFAPLATIALVILAVLLMPVIVTDEDLEREAVSALTDSLGVPVEIERLHYHPLTGIELFGVRIGPPPGFTRDVARIDRVAARWDLTGLPGQVVIEELALDRPHVVIESKLEDGKPTTNLDAINRYLESRAPPASREAAPEEPAKPGPLSPIGVLAYIAVRQLSAEMTGEGGPEVKFSGLSLTSTASIDPERLRVRSLVWVEHGEAPNLIADLPAQGASVSARLALTSSTSIDGAASEGLDIERTRHLTVVKLAGDARLQGRPLPPIELAFQTGVDLQPKEDRAELSPFALVFNRASLLDASAGLEGLYAMMPVLMGPPAAEKLAAQLGLTKKRPSGLATLSVKELALPLDVLAPYAQIFVPGLKARGTIALSPLHVKTTVLDAVRGTPPELSMKLAFDRVGVEHPALQLSVREVNGAFELARAEPGYELTGKLAIDRASQKANGAARAGLELAAAVERLTYPLPGQTSIDLVFTGEGLRAPPASIGRAEIEAHVAGLELLSADRGAAPPIETRLSMEASTIQTDTATVTGLKLATRALLDHLLVPARAPIETETRLELATAIAGTTRARDTKISLAAKLADPRAGQPIRVDSKLDLSTAAVELPGQTIEGAKIAVDSTAFGIGAPKWTPSAVDASLSVELPRVFVRDPNNGDFTTSVKLKTSAEANLAKGTATLRSFSLDLWDLIHVRASGRAAQIFAAERELDAKMEVLPIDIARLLEVAPKKAIERSLPGLVSSGKTGFSARIKGKLPASFTDVDFSAPPFDAQFRLTFDDVAMILPSRQLELRGLAGGVAAVVGKKDSDLTTDLKIAELLFTGPSPRGLEGVTLKTRAGRHGESWELETDLDAAKATGEGIAKDKEAASFDVDLTYTKRGDVHLRRLDVLLPGAGVDLAVSGRLMRRAFGVLRPELAFRTKLDLDRLTPLVPSLAGTRGVVSANLDVHAPSDTNVEVSGLLELDRFAYEKGELVVRDATGRLAVDQRIALPAPIMRERVAGAEGALGDDLERRIQELQDDFLAAKIFIDPDDILLEAPRAADYQPLRPYYAEKGARLSIAYVRSGPHVIQNIVLDGLYRSGVLRADRFAAQLWEGDLLGDLALQVTPDLNGRMRLRGTITHLNLDIPYAQANKIPPVTDPDEKEQYEIAGTIDLRVQLRERAVTMKLDLTKLRQPTLERLLGFLDPNDVNPGIGRAKLALDISEGIGLIPVAGQITITQNLIKLNVDWERLWKPRFESWSDLFWPFRLATIPLLGSLIVGNVNGALGDKLSISPYLEPSFKRAGIEDRLRVYLANRVVTGDPNVLVTNAGGIDHAR